MLKKRSYCEKHLLELMHVALHLRRKTRRNVDSIIFVGFQFSWAQGNHELKHLKHFGQTLLKPRNLISTNMQVFHKPRKSIKIHESTVI